MTEPLSVNPDDLRTTAANLADVSSQMKQVLSTLNAQLAALGSPWGNDSIGDQFANGSGGYLAQVDQVNSSISAETQLLDSLSQSLATSANNFDQPDLQPGPTPGGSNGPVLTTNGPGGPGGPSQVQATLQPALVQPATLENSSPPPETSGPPGQPAPVVGNVLATNGPAGSVAPGQVLSAVPGQPVPPGGSVAPGQMLSAVPGQPVPPGQPPVVGSNVLASGGPSGGASGSASPISAVPGVSGAPGQPPVVGSNVLASGGPSGGASGSASPISSVPGVSGAPGQPPVVGSNVLASGGPSGWTSGSASPISSMPEVAAALAQPAAEVGNVLASVVPTGGTSGPAAGFGAMMQIVEALAQPAGEGMSAAMEAAHTGAPDDSGAPGGPASPGQVPGKPAGSGRSGEIAGA